jgi:hypothetical protein
MPRKKGVRRKATRKFGGRIFRVRHKTATKTKGKQYCENVKKINKKKQCRNVKGPGKGYTQYTRG